jgi:hypothetical protein
VAADGRKNCNGNGKLQPQMNANDADASVQLEDSMRDNVPRILCKQLRGG